MKTGFFTAAFAMLALAASQTFAQGLLRPDNKRVLGTNNIIAVVEDRVITRAEVMKEVEPFIPQIRAAARSEFEFTSRVNAYVREIVQNMVDRELIVKEFKSKGMTIPQSYLDTHFDDYLNREFNGDRAEFVKFVQAQGKTIKQFRAEQEKDIIVGYMQGQKRQTVSEISPAKIKEYYDANNTEGDDLRDQASSRLKDKQSEGSVTVTVNEGVEFGLGDIVEARHYSPNVTVSVEISSKIVKAAGSGYSATYGASPGAVGR